jgi:LPXTG-motif cell wall-anchored protein
MLYKVDAANNGVFLKDARFNIYIWNEKQNDYVIVRRPNGESDFVTDANGRIVLDDSTIKKEQFAYNTAYYIVEVESPNGYYLGPERYYFYIVNKDLLKYPSNIPDNFEGDALTTGDIIYRENVKGTTEISVEKYWKNYNGNNITVTDKRVSAVTLELWQMLKGDPSSAKLYGTYTMTPDDDGNWNLTITELPKATKNADGTKGTDYLYYIKEVGVVGFNLESSTNNEGINSGTIKLFNREVEGYELPETGGIGTQVYTASGLVMMVAGAIAMVYTAIKRRKNNSYSS